MEDLASTTWWLRRCWVRILIFLLHPKSPRLIICSRCGNGLLTHILISEGYTGLGFDLRARTSWAHYPPATQESLKVHAVDPSTTHSDVFPLDSFLIGNHADELTPWIPILATMHSASGFLNIPCCAWSFDERFARMTASTRDTYSDLENIPIDSLNLGADGSTSSSYVAYRMWLAGLTRYCGWEIECDTLRIPSTRNWAIVG